MTAEMIVFGGALLLVLLCLLAAVIVEGLRLRHDWEKMEEDREISASVRILAVSRGVTVSQLLKGAGELWPKKK